MKSQLYFCFVTAVVVVLGGCLRPSSSGTSQPAWDSESVALPLRVAFGRDVELTPDWCGVVCCVDSAMVSVGVHLQFEDPSLENLIVQELASGKMDYNGRPTEVPAMYVEYARTKFGLGGVVCPEWWPPRIGRDGILMGHGNFIAFVMREQTGGKDALNVFVYRGGMVSDFSREFVGMMRSADEIRILDDSPIPIPSRGQRYVRYGRVAKL